MELARHSQVEEKVRQDVTCQVARAGHLRRGNGHVVVEEAIEDELYDATHHPTDADLVDPVGVVVVVVSTKRLEVDDGEKHETDVRQKKEVRERAPWRHRTAVVTQVVHVDDQPEHEHGGQNWKYGRGPRRR